jgi:hypothetical protein
VRFAFVVVLVAALSGLASEVALRAISPDLGPPLALFLIAIGLFVAAWGRGRKTPTKTSAHAGQSFTPA